MNTDDLQPANIAPEQLPSIIGSQFQALEDLDKKVREAKRKADAAHDSAENARSKSAGFGKKKEAIEALQDAAYDFSTSQSALVEAQEFNFKLQEKLGKVIQYLFGLGVSNLAANRTVVREIELRLKNASEEQLSDLARQELLGVIKQLKAQEDIMVKQQEISQKLKNIADDSAVIQAQANYLSGQLQMQGGRLQTQARRLAEGEAKDKEQDKLISEQAAKSKEHDRRLAEGEIKDEEQDKLISQQAAKSKEHDRRLAEGETKDEEQDKLISQQAAKSKEYDRILAEQIAKDSELEQSIAQQLEKNRQRDRRIEDCMEQGNVLQAGLEAQSQALAVLTQKVQDQEIALKKMQDWVLQLIADTQKNVSQKADKKLVIPAYAFTVAAFVLALLRFFI